MVFSVTCSMLFLEKNISIGSWWSLLVCVIHKKFQARQCFFCNSSYPSRVYLFAYFFSLFSRFWSFVQYKLSCSLLYKCLIFWRRNEVEKNLYKQSCSFYNEPWYNMLKVFSRLMISFKYAWFFGHFQPQYTYKLYAYKKMSV